MVAPRINAVLLEVPQMRPMRSELPKAARQLLPWGDPYIRSLVAKLKKEILAEKAAQQGESELQGEAPPSMPGPGVQFDHSERYEWPEFEDD